MLQKLKLRIAFALEHGSQINRLVPKIAKTYRKIASRRKVWSFWAKNQRSSKINFQELVADSFSGNPPTKTDRKDLLKNYLLST